MIKRIKQFFAALFAKLTNEDEKYIRSLLNAEEYCLFDEMSTGDRYHSLKVSRLLGELSPPDCDEKFLRRLGLLHDIGRDGKSVGTLGKVFFVLVRAFLPSLLDKAREDKTKNDILHLLYVCKEHPKLSEKKLRNIGDDKEASIIAKHHEREREDDEIELKLLRIADEAN